VNSIDDFCLWAPPEPNSQIGVTEQIQVAWCTKDGHGSRTIPQGALTGVHFVQTPDFIQITGVGDLTPMNIQRGDSGGELDGHGADGFGNPHGALIYSDAFGGGMTQITEWTKWVTSDVSNHLLHKLTALPSSQPLPSLTQLHVGIRIPHSCMQARTECLAMVQPRRSWEANLLHSTPIADDDSRPSLQQVFDEMGCEWNMPADYSRGFDTCQGDSGIPMGLYSSNGNAWGSTFSRESPFPKSSVRHR